MDRFFSHPEYGFHLIDFIPYSQLENFTEKDLVHRFFNKRPDEIFLCYTRMNEDLLHGLMELSESNFVKINIVSDLLLKDKYASLVNYNELPVLHISHQEQISLKIKLLKRGFDITFSSIIMLCGSPIFVTIYLITKFSSKGPAFYKQERVGKYGRLFHLYKFRSMHAEPNGPQLACENDPRITNWGKIIRRTRLDELPQFWNVFIGDMSVVGPRPERQYYLEKIIEKAPSYKDLMRIKPGITSIGQVSYGYAENVDEMCTRARYDLIYLKNISFRSDMNIILKTVKVMAQAKGK
jgi:lipopolysaccharide/colanic/teichoic acid biosynthesis glycosyltransferase